MQLEALAPTAARQDRAVAKPIPSQLHSQRPVGISLLHAAYLTLCFVGRDFSAANLFCTSASRAAA
jgi:hypothetical protein